MWYIVLKVQRFKRFRVQGFIGLKKDRYDLPALLNHDPLEP
jgi:hypothetical protein